MKRKDTETRMREMEYFRGLHLFPGSWTIVRVDGRAFTRFTAERFEKPFDAHFRDLMTATAEALMVDLHGVYAYTCSDEISVLFPPGWDIFNRRQEKIVSVSAGLASSIFTLACGEPVHFDSRVWGGSAEADVVEYFRWRQSDAARCALHGWCYWTLRKKGMDAQQATRVLDGKGPAFKNELLFSEGINFNELALWQRRGVGLYWEEYFKQGYDPLRKTMVKAKRRRVRTDLELPMSAEYDAFIWRIIRAVAPP